VEAEAGPAVAAIVLAAGRSTRMGGPNKLLQALAGRPLVRIAAEAALASQAAPVIVVTGHQADAVQEALQGLEVTFVHNPDFAEGLSTSVRSGIAALPASADAAVICLGDMPLVNAGLIDRLIEAFDPQTGALIVLPSKEGQRGNPVLWARRFFDDLKNLSGDSGARQILKDHADGVVEVPVADDSSSLDVDTPEVFASLSRPGA
jgi:molybdenum cofactor cytidylyltransferase